MPSIRFRRRTGVRAAGHERGRCEGVAMTFQGYRRSDGKVGIRNHVLILPTSICAVRVATDIAREVSGCVAACHAYGCCQVGADARLTLRTLVNTAANPNVGAVLVIGLGCEGLEPLSVLQAIE